MKLSIRIVFFLVLFFLVSCKSKKEFAIDASQDLNYIPYYLKVYEADSLYIVKNYQKSFEILDSLFQKYKPLNLEQYKEFETYISCYYQIGKRKKIRDYILKSFEFYGSQYKYAIKDSLFREAFIYSKLSLNDCNIHRSKYINKLKISLRDTVKQMVKDDQLVRQGVKSYDKNMKMIDSLNEIKIIYILEKHGFPSEKMIGEFYLDSVMVDLKTVFLHTKNDFKNDFLLPILKKSIINGTAYPEIFAVVYDRMSIESTEKQYYGSYKKRDGKLMPLRNEKKIDSIRKNIGLPNINYLDWRYEKKYGMVPYY